MVNGKQLSLFPGVHHDIKPLQPVNVASVPQRSPFRYPGGKTWFVPTFRKWIRTVIPAPKTLVEPFAGGGIISLTAIFEELVEHTVMAEIDEEIAAVWQAIVEGDSEWLANRILTFDITKENVIKEIEKPVASIREKAFQTILRNRTLHGGILAKGSGFIKFGENGKGIRSRWYPATLARRLRDLVAVAGKIDFRIADGLNIIKEFAADDTAVFFVDPPYTAGGKRAGRRLYQHCELNHEQLFSICSTVKGALLLTYDDADEVKAMAREHGFQVGLIPMTNTHHETKLELVIGVDLSWLE